MERYWRLTARESSIPSEDGVGARVGEVGERAREVKDPWVRWIGNPWWKSNVFGRRRQSARVSSMESRGRRQAAGRERERKNSAGRAAAARPAGAGPGRRAPCLGSLPPHPSVGRRRRGRETVYAGDVCARRESVRSEGTARSSPPFARGGVELASRRERSAAVRRWLRSRSGENRVEWVGSGRACRTNRVRDGRGASADLELSCSDLLAAT